MFSELFNSVLMSDDRPLLIAGIDVGVHASVALLDLEGEIRHIATFLSPKLSDITFMISSFGNILSLSTDREKTPVQAKKIASSLGCGVISPQKNLTNKKKRILIEKHTKPDKLKLDSHEKAALASAIFAYKKHVPRMKKLREKLEKEGMPDKYRKFRDDYLLGNFRLSEELKGL